MNVYCVLWGDKYTEDHVFRLRDQVAANLPIPHEFRCVTDREIWGIDTLDPFEDWPGWWQKVALFHPLMPVGLNLYLDLDVTIVDDLTPLILPTMRSSPGPIAGPANWAESGHGGIQSSFMVWKSCRQLREIWRRFDPANAHWPPVNQRGTFWGDQEWITHLRDEQVIYHIQTPSYAIVSYKYHVRKLQAIPDHAKVVVFHGDPKPWDPDGQEFM